MLKIKIKLNVNKNENKVELIVSPFSFNLTSKDFRIYRYFCIDKLNCSFIPMTKEWETSIYDLDDFKVKIDSIISFKKEKVNFYFVFNKEEFHKAFNFLFQMKKNADIKLKLSSAEKISNPNETLVCLEGKLNKELFEFQKVPIEYFKYQNKILIADQMGLGKTIESLSILEHYNLYPVLIICPSVLRFNWDAEIQLWLKYEKKIQIIKSVNETVEKDRDIYIVSYSGLTYFNGKKSKSKSKTKKLSKVFKQLKKLKLKIIIADEAHYLKNYKSKRSRAVRGLAKKIENIILLTGTPILNKPYELINLLRLVDQLNVLGGREKFIQRYCDPYFNGYGYSYGANNEEELQLKLRQTFMIRREKNNVLEFLPEKLIKNMWVDLDSYKEYNKVMHEFVDWYKENILPQKIEKNQDKSWWYHKSNVPDTILSKLGYLRQTVVESKINQIIDWTDNSLKSINKLIIFGYHRKPLQMLHEHYKNNSVLFIGGMSKKTKNIVDKFQNDDNINLFIGSVQTGGVGLNLHAASHILFTELPWRWSDIDQAMDRIHRIGQTATCVNYYFLLANHTIDKWVFDKVISKKNISEKLFNIDNLVEFLLGEGF